jgi:protocatechuate 4,5-dioxygenase, alpha chain
MVDRYGIPGTRLFDGELAQRGYALNKMCFSLNDAENRAAFLADEAAYLDRFDLTPEQRDAVARRDVLGMLAAGGNVYYLAKMAGAWGLGVQDLGALQTGVSVEEFKQRLLDAGRCAVESELDPALDEEATV